MSRGDFVRGDFVLIPVVIGGADDHFCGVGYLDLS